MSDQKCSLCGTAIHGQAETGLCTRCLLHAALPATEPSHLKIRCPHCHQPVEMLAESPQLTVNCPACDTRIDLVDDSAGEYFPAGKRIKQFELLAIIGSGAFGSVWKARDTELDRIVAIKTPRHGQISSNHSAQFLKEARAAAQVRHPGIVAVHEVGLDDGRIYIVSDFVDGESLAERLQTQPLTPREAAQLCARVAESIEVAHQAGVIHRDLKPANILIDAQGLPHVTDFGMAKREAGEITMTWEGKILGTPAYMSPEQARGEPGSADRRSDVYSLGVILFEMLTGERPFRGDSRMLLHQVQHDDPPRPRKLRGDVPRDLETICLRCLNKEPGRRYATAGELHDDLDRFLRGEPVVARPVSSWERQWRWAKRNPAVSLLALSTVFALVGGLAASLIFAFWAQDKAAEATAARSSTRQQTIKVYQQLARSKRDQAFALRSSAVANRQSNAKQSIRDSAEALRSAETLIDSEEHSIPEARRQHQAFAAELLPKLREEALFWLSTNSAQRIGSADFSTVVERELTGGSALGPEWSPNQIASSPDGDWLAVEQLTQQPGGFEVKVVSTDDCIVRHELTFENRRDGSQTILQKLLGLAFSNDSSQVLIARAESQRDQRNPRRSTFDHSMVIERVDLKSGGVIAEVSLQIDDQTVGAFPSDAWRIIFNADRSRAMLCRSIPSDRSSPISRSATPDVAITFDTDHGAIVGVIKSETFLPYRFLRSDQEVLGLQIGRRSNGYRSEQPIEAMEIRSISGDPPRRRWTLDNLGLPQSSSGRETWELSKFWPGQAWISPDEKYVAGWIDLVGAQILLIDVERDEPVALVPIQGQSRDCGVGGFTSDGSRLIIAMHDRLHLVTVPDGVVEFTHRYAPNAPAVPQTFNPAPRAREPIRLALLGCDRIALHFHHRPVGESPGRPVPNDESARFGDEIELWDLATASLPAPRRYRHNRPLRAVTMSDDGRLLYLAPTRPDRVPSNYSSSSWPPPREDALVVLDQHQDRPFVLHYSPEAASVDGVRSTSDHRLWSIPLRDHRVQTPFGFDATGTVLIEPPPEPSIGRSSLNHSWAVRSPDDGSMIRSLDEFDFLSASDSLRYYILQRLPRSEERSRGASSDMSVGVYLLDTVANRLNRISSSGGYLRSDGFVFSPLERFVVGQFDDETVSVIRTSDEQIVASFQARNHVPGTTRFDSSEERLLLQLEAPAGNSRFHSRLVNLDSGDTVHTFPGTIDSLVTTPDLTAAAWIGPSDDSDKERGPVEVKLWQGMPPVNTLLTSPHLSSRSQLWLTQDATRLFVMFENRDDPSEQKNVVELWDVTKREMIFSTIDLDGSVSDLHVSLPHGTFAVSYQPQINANADHRLEIRNTSDGSILRSLAEIRAHRLFRNQDLLAVSCPRFEHRLLSMKDGTDYMQGSGELKHGGLPSDPTERFLVASHKNQNAELLDTVKKSTASLDVPVSELLAFDRSGDVLVYRNHLNGAEVKCWESRQARPGDVFDVGLRHRSRTANDVDIMDASISPDHRRILVDANRQFRLASLTQDGDDSDLVCFARRAHGEEVSAIDIHQSSNLIVTASDDGTLGLWNRNGQYRAMLEGFEKNGLAAKFHPHKPRLFVLDLSGHLHAWNLTEVSEGVELQRDENTARKFSGLQIAISRDGAVIAAVQEHDSLIAFIDSATLEVVQFSDSPVSAESMGFGPDDNLVGLSLDGQLARWNAKTGKQEIVAATNDGPIRKIAIAGDGTIAAVGQSVSLWTADLQPLLKLAPATGKPLDVVWSGDGRYLSVIDDNQSVTVYEIEPIRSAMDSFELAW